MPLYLGNNLVSGLTRPIDKSPTSGSENFVTSGGVKDYIDQYGWKTVAVQNEAPEIGDLWIDTDEAEGRITPEEINAVNKDGDKMNGELVLAGDPVNEMAAATKKYVDEKAPTKTSQLTNDSGFITSAPVTSVNSKTGAVSLSASDVGAVSKTGDYMTGTLYIADNENDTAKLCIFEHGNVAYLRNKIDDANNSEIAVRDGSLWLSKYVDGNTEFNVEVLHTGNKNLIAPADIGAVKNTGDTMTGTLKISNSNIGKIILDNTTKNSITQIGAGTNTLGLHVYSNKEMNGDSREFVINTSANGTIDKSLMLKDKVGDTQNTYLVLHTGNSNMTRLVSADTTPSNNNEICWTYK